MFLTRVAGFCLVLAAEALLASLLFDSVEIFRFLGEGAGPRMGWCALWSVHFLIGFAAIGCTFFYLQYREVLDELVLQARAVPVDRRMVGAHFCALGFLFFCSFRLARFSEGAYFLPWLAGCAGVLVFAGLALLPLRLWSFCLRRTGLLVVYAAAGAAAAASLVLVSGRFWVPMSGFTFALVRVLLSPVLPAMVVQPENLRIGSTRFTAVISPSCSGLEGVALLLVFLAIWLILFRKEIYFPQALVLVPVGVAVLVFLNGVRIAALILIGHFGARDIAAQGFHSQAGWIMFNLVAFGISVGARRVRWISRRQISAPASAEGERDESVSVYLIPFLAVLLAGMVSRAASGKFEWFYGLRLVGAGLAYWAFRSRYWEMIRAWRVSWVGLAAGVGVFAIWFAMDSGSAAVPGVSAGVTWILLRVLTAVVVVPVAEELAFRGYLMRRLAGRDFEAVKPGAVPWWAIGVSSLIFGLLHGARWGAGAVAGVVYSLVYRRRGNLGEAVLAHGVTNALLAVYVLVSGDWRFW